MSKIKQYQMVGPGMVPIQPSDTPIDWRFCVLCQQNTKEPLQCPAKSKRADAGAGYRTTAANIVQFNELNDMPINVNIKDIDEGDGIEAAFVAHSAVWHKSCNLKFNADKLTKAKKRARDEIISSEPSPMKMRRRCSEVDSLNSPVCLFCDKIHKTENDVLHKASQFNIDRNVRTAAIQLQDTKLLAKLAAGDMMAIDAVYHIHCLMDLYNRARGKRREHVRENHTDQDIESNVFAELVAYIEEFRMGDDKAHAFMLSDLIKLYSNRLQEMGGNCNYVHATRLKDKLLGALPDLRAQRNAHGNIVFMFDTEIGNAIQMACEPDYDADALCLANVAKIVRKDIFSMVRSFNGTFQRNCQENSVPTSLKRLISMILDGPSIKNQSEQDIAVSKAVLSISQLLVYNSVKHTRTGSTTGSRHTRDKETPLPIYIGLKIHAETRKRGLIDALHDKGLCISYDRVLQISTDVANSACERFEQENVVCPPKLLGNLFTTGAVDNIDHNPSSTTAHDSFHGTAISLMQHPSDDQPGTDRGIVLIHENEPKQRKISQLPAAYTQVPPAVLVTKDIIVPATYDLGGATDHDPLSTEYEWLEHVSRLINKDTLDKDDYMSWPAYHAHLQQSINRPQTQIALLPLFMDNAHSVAMILHAMNVVKSAVHHLNPEQVIVLAMDQPLFAIAKQIQWTWPEIHGEGDCVIMFGGLHVEIAAFKALGEWVEDSGWTSAIVNAGIATRGTAESFINASHLARTRHAHQVTAASLYILQKSAYDMYVRTLDEGHAPLSFELWCDTMRDDQPQFMYWSRVLEFELCILEFVRSIREANFTLYVDRLGQLLPWFFALDRIHYSRWLSVHYRDMITLEQNQPVVFEQFSHGGFVAHKTPHAFSAIALDHAHEQVNAAVKGDGGAVGLTENPSALRRWMIAGPEISRMIEEFEATANTATITSTRHHEQIPSVQSSFAKDVRSLVSTFEEFGNPFKEESCDLLVLDTKDIMSKSVIKSVKDVLQVGKTQYKTFVEERFVLRSKPISDPITMNKLSLFNTPEAKGPSKAKSQIIALKNDCALFSRLYIACQSREGKLEEFFVHENHPWPPSLSIGGKLRQGTKSDLLKCLEKIVESVANAPDVDMKVIDGAASVHMLNPGTSKTFSDYATHVFIPYIEGQLRNVQRLDIVWDTYKPDSLKNSTRESRGTGQRRRVGASVAMPLNWKTFLQVNENKTELFYFLADKITTLNIPGKQIYTTKGECVLSAPLAANVNSLQPCTQEEADTRILFHVDNGVQLGCRKILIRTVDTDVVVLAVAYQQHIKATELWVAFGTGKHFRYIPAHAIASNLGDKKCTVLPVFHAITGCDTTSCFSGKGKKTAWEAWNACPAVTDSFISLVDQPETISDACMEEIERFVVVLYDRTNALNKVNDARQQLFTKRSRTLENIPPTKAALMNHVMRATFQAGFIWSQSLVRQPVLPNPSKWGWEKQESGWVPVWSNLPAAQQSCYELIHCGCKKACRGLCKCSKANLPCTALCACGGKCYDTR